MAFSSGFVSSCASSGRLTRSFLVPMPDEAPVTSAKAAVAGFDAVLINLLLSVLFASHPCGGELTVFLNRACFCFDRSYGVARLSDDCRVQCGLPAPGPCPG